MPKNTKAARLDDSSPTIHTRVLYNGENIKLNHPNSRCSIGEPLSGVRVAGLG